MYPLAVFPHTHLLPLPSGETLLVGAPPEALKLLLRRKLPTPTIVLLPPDPLFAEGMNQASFEFLLYHHLFVRGGLREGRPFFLVCDPEQRERIAGLVRQMLHGPDARELEAWGAPAAHRRQLLREIEVVSGEAARRPLESMARVVAFENGQAELPDGTRLEDLRERGEVRVRCRGMEVRLPRRHATPEALPLYFPEVEAPARGPRFGVQVIGSASGFSEAEWSSCFLVWINGQPLVVDGTPYLGEHLRRLGIEEAAVLGYVVTHNHEDHANLFGQLVNRRPVTVLTSGPVMGGLVARLAAILGCAEAEARGLFRWVPLSPGLEEFGEPLHWFGAEIRAWYSVHTLPTLGIEIAMEGQRIRMPGDTLWGRKLRPLLEQGVLSPARHAFIQRAYSGADVLVADAGGGSIHPDPAEVRELARGGCCGLLMATHVSEGARALLPSAEPGALAVLLPRAERTPEECAALFGSPLLRAAPKRWLVALLQGGTPETPQAEFPAPEAALFVTSGRLWVVEEGREAYPLEPGDLFHPSLAPEGGRKRLRPAAEWTRLLRIPTPLFDAFLEETELRPVLERLHRTRRWWREVIGAEADLESLLAFAQLTRERRFAPGEAIVRQGERARHFYVVTEGVVEVVREDGVGRSLGRFGAGYHFGEIALLNREPRTATVRAVGPVRALELPGRAFLRELMRIPLARYRLGRVAARRKAELLRGGGEAPAR